MNQQLISIAINKVIIPDNYPRQTKSITSTSVKDSVDAINALKSKGIPIPPIIVSNNGGKYVLVKGLRRLAGATQAGDHKIDAIVQTYEDPMLAACAYQVNTVPLNPVEKAWAIHYLHKLDYTNQEIALFYGFGTGGRSVVSRYLRILDLPQEVQNLLESGLITFGHGCELVGLDSVLASRLADAAVKMDLSVSQLRDMKKRWLSTDSEEDASILPGTQDQLNRGAELLRNIENELADWFSAKPSIKTKPNGEFVLSFACKTSDELTDILTGLKIAAQAIESPLKETNHVQNDTH